MSILTMEISWLHISDIHFGHGSEHHKKDQDIVGLQIIEDARKLKKKIGTPDFLFVTGDIAFSADPNEQYPKAEKWLNDLLNAIDCKWTQVYIVPGNHDVDRGLIKKSAARTQIHEYYKNQPGLVDEYFSDEESRRILWLKFQHFSKFSTCCQSRIITEGQPFWVDAFKKDGKEISIVGLNTCLLSFHGDSKGMLALGNKQLLEVQRISQENLTIILQHHPNDWLNDGELISATLRDRPHVQLCGHTHRARGTIETPFTNEGGHICITAGAGHCDEESNPNERHHYSWGRLTLSGFEYYPRIWHSDSRKFVGDRNSFRNMDNDDRVLIPRNKLPDPINTWLPPLPSPTNPPKGENDDNIASSVIQIKQSDLLLSISSWIRRAICYNQKEYFQFSFLASRFHKELKDKYRSEPYNFDEISNLKNSLDDFLIRNTIKIYKRHFEFLLEYFGGTCDERRSRILPRICAKSSFVSHSAIGENRDGELFTLVRDGGKAIYEKLLRTEENTGFLYVKNEGKYYFCNNIPEKSRQDEYKNPRLIQDCVALYSEASTLDRNTKDSNWIKCWRRVEVQDQNHIEPDWRSCYKSTLIVPMTLDNSSLTDSFAKLFKLDEHIDSYIVDAGIDRSIFGFLCFDHTCTNYFNEEIDAHIGYIFSDLMSLYMLTILNYTKISESYRNIEQELLRRGRSKK